MAQLAILLMGLAHVLGILVEDDVPIACIDIKEKSVLIALQATTSIPTLGTVITVTAPPWGPSIGSLLVNVPVN